MNAPRALSAAMGRRPMKHGFVWVTAGFFAVSLVGHWVFAWAAYVQEQEEHGQPVSGEDYFAETMRDTLENWQSEFLQLIWQVAGLAFLLHVGSSQSKEGDERMEAKIDAVLEHTLGKDGAQKLEKSLERRFPKK